MSSQPKLIVRLTSFPESNGKRNWTALLVREEPFNGLVGTCGGITIAHGELWNRVAYAAERARFLIGDRDTEPYILDYGYDIETPEKWKGEIGIEARKAKIYELGVIRELSKKTKIVETKEPKIPFGD